MFRECRFLVILFSIIALFSGCPNSHRISTNIPGKTTGDIYVDSPEVYTRERLVNDRLEQEAWLRSQLAKTDKLEFGIQGLADIRSFLGISTTLGIEADPLEVALKKAQAEQSVEGIKQQEEIDDLNYRIKVLELLNKIKALSDESTDNTQNNPTNQQESNTNEESKGETKSEELETTDESDESSEEKETTIGTKYDELIKLLAEPKSISTTEAKPSPIDLFRDKLAYREELRTELIENSLDDRHDLQGNTLYRLKFDTTIFPDYDTSAWAVIEVTIKRGDQSNLELLYGKWLDVMKIYINDEFNRRLNFPTAKEKEELLMFTINELKWIKFDKEIEEQTKLRIKIYAEFIGIKEEELKEKKEEEIDKLIKKEDFEKLEKRIEGKLKKIKEEIEIEVPIKYDIEENLETLASKRQLTAKELKKEYVAKLIMENYRNIRRMNEYFNLDYDSGRIYIYPPDMRFLDEYLEEKEITYEQWDETPIEQKMKVDEEVWKKIIDSFRSVLDESSLTSCYAATPKEMVQRISDVASRRGATQLSLSLGLLMGSAGLKSLIEYARVTEGIFQAIHRQPLVVGFSKEYLNSSNKSASNHTFGWIVGPRFSLQENGKGSYFRHTPVQQSLSALVSLPSWWNEVDLYIKRYWKSEKGKIKKKFDTFFYTVKLPGDLLGIKDALTGIKMRPPVPGPLEECPMEIGKEGNLVIEGTDLWRNPVVFIGSQQADRISVLPNMEGIVAHFKEMKQPAGWETTDMSKEVMVKIWTSEGHKEAGRITLHGSKKMLTQEPKKIEVKVRPGPLICDEMAILELTSGSTPKIYNDLSVGIRLYKGENPTFHTIKPSKIDNKEVRFFPNEENLPKLKKQLRNGTELELALILKERPGSVPKEFISKNRPIYYKTKAASKVRLSPLKGSNLPLRVEFTFPKEVKSAYPKFDYSNISFNAEVVTHDDINLIVEKGERKDSCWPAWIKVKQDSKSKWDNAHKNDLYIQIDMRKGDSALELDQNIITITKAQDKK